MYCEICGAGYELVCGPCVSDEGLDVDPLEASC